MESGDESPHSKLRPLFQQSLGFEEVGLPEAFGEPAKYLGEGGVRFRLLTASHPDVTESHGSPKLVGFRLLPSTDGERFAIGLFRFVQVAQVRMEVATVTKRH